MHARLEQNGDDDDDVPASDIGANFSLLLENEEGSDVTFSVSGEKFHAHKLVLAARSDVFETELLNMIGGADEESEVTTWDGAVVRRILWVANSKLSKANP